MSVGAERCQKSLRQYDHEPARAAWLAHTPADDVSSQAGRRSGHRQCNGAGGLAMAWHQQHREVYRHAAVGKWLISYHYQHLQVPTK